MHASKCPGCRSAGRRPCVGVICVRPEGRARLLGQSLEQPLCLLPVQRGTVLTYVGEQRCNLIFEYGSDCARHHKPGHFLPSYDS